VSFFSKGQLWLVYLAKAVDIGLKQWIYGLISSRKMRNYWKEFSGELQRLIGTGASL